MWLVKLGGSLMSSNLLSVCLNILSDTVKGKALILPGGGIFADHIRILQKEYRFDDKAAHNMALLAMEQYAIYCQSIQPELILSRQLKQAESLLMDDQLVCFLPTQYLSECANIPENWSFTSDSIAALLAADVGAEGLILLKSVEQAALDFPLEQLAHSGIVDSSLPEFAEKLSCSIYCVSAKDCSQLQEMII